MGIIAYSLVGRGARYTLCVAVIAFVSLNSKDGGAQDLIGQASVIDGDTIEIHGSRIRIFGIDAPESTQLCRGADSLQYKCGAKAANELANLIERRPVSCAPVSLDRYKRTVATCSVNGLDIGEWLVRNGHALDWPQYSRGKYASAQSQARRAELGMWAGSFAEPWRYRECVKIGGGISACSDI